MQTREQIKNWKVVASVATVAALGVSGLAVASPGEPSGAPSPIEVEDQRQSDGAVLTTSTTLGFDVVGGPSFTPEDDSLDSPLASADVNDSPAASNDLDSVDSPQATTTSTTATTEPRVDDSPDQADSPAVNDSPDQVDSADSPAPAPAPEPADSPDDVDSVDSADSADSLDS